MCCSVRSPEEGDPCYLAVGRRGMTHRKAACSDCRGCHDLKVILGSEFLSSRTPFSGVVLTRPDSNYATSTGGKQHFCGRAQTSKYLVCLLARHRRLIQRAQILIRFELREGLPQGSSVSRGE